VLSSGKSYKVFEQYPWEGHSSNYGPKGNRLNSSYGVGVCKNIFALYNCDMEIGFICRTSVGVELMSLLAKGLLRVVRFDEGAVEMTPEEFRNWTNKGEYFPSDKGDRAHWERRTVLQLMRNPASRS
jgi:hypothetical protein